MNSLLVTPIVYIPQEPMRKDRATDRWVSKGLNLASATEYGELAIVWGPETSVLQRGMMEREALIVAEKYRDNCDWVVALGSPSLIALLGWAIGRSGKGLRILEWDKALSRYNPTLGNIVLSTIER